MVTMYFPGGKAVEVVGDGPSVLEPRTVRYWCRHTMELEGSQVDKAGLLVEHECVQYLGENKFVCLPLNTHEDVMVGARLFKKRAFSHDYNSSEYTITRLSEKTFKCNCQGWHTKEQRGEIVPEGANCSHVLALFYAFKLKKFQKPRTEGLLVGVSEAVA